jgi:filamentous hemagglutinin family protein
MGALILVLLLAVPGPAKAQVVTNITESGLGTTTTTVMNGVEIGGGTAIGTDILFHSFGQFNVAEGNTAMFLNDHALAFLNIIGRITGGDPSSIFGTVDTKTNFPVANLFLMNPFGFIFGENSVLNVGGPSRQ